VAKNDIIISLKSQRELKRTIGRNIVIYKEIVGGHSVMLKGKDMKWFENEVMPIIA